MAINVPVSTPNAPQFQPPDSLVQGYLSRPNAAMVAQQGLGNAFNSAALFRQYQDVKQLEALKAYASIAQAVGPDSANAVAGQIPNMPNWNQNASYQPQTQPAVQNTNIKAMPMPQPGPMLTSGGDSSQPSEHIQNSIDMGHPDFTGHLAKIQSLQNKMAGFANKGEWGKEQSQQVAAQITAEKASMDAEMAPVDYASKVEQERLATDKPISEEISKQRQKTTTTDTADLLYKQFSDTFLGKDAQGNQVDLTNPSTNIPFVAGGSAKLANLTGGRYGNKAGGDMLSQSKPFANSLVALLTSSGRMNPTVAGDFVEGILPKPDELTAQKLQKMQNIRNLIDTIRSGDQQALDDVIGTLKGKQVGRTSGSPVNAPKIGELRKGFKFKGGDPSQPSNWVKQ